MKGKFVAYYRVSTAQQGVSGLGLEAQKAHVLRYLNGGDWELVAEFEEVESGNRNERPELALAVATCRKHKAKLVIAKLDRLARNAAFLLNLRESGIDFVCADMPNATKFTVGIMALVAEQESDMISQRTKDALAAAKARGKILGNPRLAEARQKANEASRLRAIEHAAAMKPIIAEIQAGGTTTLRGIAQSLNARGLTTPTGKQYAAQSVKNVLAMA